MIEEYGLFVIPTMPLVTKIMMDHPQFKVTFASLPWDRYLGNWFSSAVTSPVVTPPVPVVPGPMGVTAWAASQPWLQQQQQQQQQAIVRCNFGMSFSMLTY